jgi:hypothetical protein
MKPRWQKLLLSITFWLATEIWFNLVGIDDLADYSEFIFHVYNNPEFLNFFHHQICNVKKILLC